ncbi:MAG TPA: photosynthetic reaction center cytochrome c subunit family protein, partial [Candidatus Solibacter sp.]|nr:photosynthetic reaction center cytochrome c subunit family protein [Candidatus Solibacter sp.]
AANHYIAGQETRGEMHGVPLTSRTSWEGASLVIESSAKIMGKELRLTDRYTLSADGNRLTMTERHQFGTEPEGVDTQVFDRRPPGSWEPDKPPKPAEEVYKNIQVLKGLPAPKLRTTMLNVTAWLGVECVYCHTVPQFEKDDKPAKQTARGMYRMVETLNRDPATAAVTCYTCHRGSAKPQNTPPQ